MCLGYILPGVFLGYGLAALALLEGYSFMRALEILVASGFGIALAGALWHGIVMLKWKAKRPLPNGSQSKRTSGDEEEPATQALNVGARSDPAASSEVLAGPSAFTSH